MMKPHGLILKRSSKGSQRNPSERWRHFGGEGWGRSRHRIGSRQNATSGRGAERQAKRGSGTAEAIWARRH
uniref:Uncharacterized protein n=1 Tax=Aegilops tauschii subsp. strangulata TaxID=200361 RepID=A0A453IVX7_AEGTS